MKTVLNSMVGRVPWWAKIGAKVVLSSLPIEYGFWKRLGFFQHGAMEDPMYAIQIFKRHFDRVRGIRTLDNFVGLELGPGHSLLSAMVAYAFGAKAYYLVDVGAFATSDMKPYHAMATVLQEMGLPTPNVINLTSLDTILASCGATYCTNGLTSLRAIPDGSVDFVWSQAVFEHLRRADFMAIMCELRRILRVDGVCSHAVDLQDHMGGRLNNLRFSERVWESPFMVKSGFYTDRIRYSEMLRLFKEADFVAEVAEVKKWDGLPTPRMKLCTPFGDLSDDELCVSGFDVILKPIR